MLNKDVQRDDQILIILQDIQNQIKTNDENLNGRIDRLDERLSGRIDTLDKNLNKKIDDLDEKLSGRIDDLDEKLSNRMDVMQKDFGEFKIEMYDFRNEMHGFKHEVREFNNSVSENFKAIFKWQSNFSDSFDVIQIEVSKKADQAEVDGLKKMVLASA